MIDGTEMSFFDAVNNTSICRQAFIIGGLEGLKNQICFGG